MKKIVLAFLFIIMISGVGYSQTKLIDMTEDTSPTNDDLIYVVDSPGGTPADRKVTLGDAITKAHGLSGSGYILTLDGSDVTTATNSIGSVSVDLGTAVASGHAVTMDANGVLQTAFANLLPDAADGAALGSATYEWSDLYLADGGKIYFQNDQSVYITPSASTLTVTGNLLATGIVDGTAPIVITATSAGYTLGATYKSGYTFTNPVAAAATFNFTLPTAAAGLQYCVANGATKTGILKVNASAAGQYIDLDGTLSATGGFVSATAVAGNMGCFVGIDATNWKAVPTKGTWSRD